MKNQDQNLSMIMTIQYTEDQNLDIQNLDIQEYQ